MSEPSEGKAATWLQRSIVWGVRAVIVLVTVALLADTFRRVWALSVPVPYGDWVHSLEAMSRLSFWQYLWVPSNEHIIVFPRLLFYLDVRLAAGTDRFLVSANLLLAVAIVLAYAWFAARNIMPGRWHQVLCLCVLATAYFNCTHTFTLTMGYMAQHWLANSLIFCFAYVFSGMLVDAEPGATVRRFAASIMIALAAGLTSGGGLALLPVAAVVGVLFRQRWRYVIAVAAAFALLYVAYVKINPQASKGLLWQLWKSPAETFRFYLAFLGAPYLRFLNWPAETVFWTPEPWKALGIGICVLLSGAFLVVHEVIRFRAATRFSIFHVFLILLVFAIGVLACATRLELGVYEGTNAKYACTVLLAWLSIFCLAVKVLRQYGTLSSVHAHAAWMGLYVPLLLMVLTAHFRESRAWAGWANRQWAGGTAVFNGVGDMEPVRYLYALPDVYYRMSQTFLRDRRLAIFAHYPFTLGDRLTDYCRVVTTATVAGNFDSRESTPTAAGEGLRLRGWAWDSARKEPIRTVLFADPQGRIVGIAHATEQRSDVAAWLKNPRGADAGWTAVIRADEKRQPVTAYALLGRGGTVFSLGAR